MSGAFTLIMLTSPPGAPRLVRAEHRMLALLVGSPSPIGGGTRIPRLRRTTRVFGIAREAAPSGSNLTFGTRV